MTTGSGIQVDNGDFTRLHNTILEKLALARLSASEYRCLMFLFRETYGWQRKEHEISMTEWAKGVGIDPAKRHNVWRTLQGMIDQRVIYAKPNGNNRPMTWGFNKNFDQWDVSLFDETVISTDNSLDDESVIPDDNTFEPTVITPHNSTVIKPHNTSVITGDNRHIRRKKDIKKAKENTASQARAPTLQQELFGAICEALGWDHRTLAENDKKQVAQAVGILQKANYTVEDIRRFMTEIWFRDWRWTKESQRPTLKQLRQEIGKIRAQLPSNGANNGTYRKNSTANGGQSDGGNSDEYDPAIQQRMDEHRAKRKAEGSQYYQ